MLLIINNAGQGDLSSFFFKYADTILKKYSSTVATIFTGFASPALFGHTFTINFMLGISIVFISMHQAENTSFPPRSPYAASKVAARWEAYGILACNGILFNIESSRRGENFVTRKITRAVGRIKISLQHKLFLGNLQASRDWGFARDYVEAMWLMLQQEKPDDYVVATEESHTVEEFLDKAFGYVSLNWKDHVAIDKRYFRPTEVDNLKGDSIKAREALRWKPKVGFEQLVKMMVDEDIDLANLGLEGFLKDVSVDKAGEQLAHLRSQVYILWGTLLMSDLL